LKKQSFAFIYCRYGSVTGEGIVNFESIIKSFMVMTVTAFSVVDTFAVAPDIIKGSEMSASVFEVMDGKTEMACYTLGRRRELSEEKLR